MQICANPLAPRYLHRSLTCRLMSAVRHPGPGRNQWTTMRIHKNQGTIVKINEKLWKINQHQLKHIKINENQQETMQIYEKQWNMFRSYRAGVRDCTCILKLYSIWAPRTEMYYAYTTFEQHMWDEVALHTTNVCSEKHGFIRFLQNLQISKIRIWVFQHFSCFALFANICFTYAQTSRICKKQVP